MKVCFQNLAMYNNGELLFKWAELPLDEDEVTEILTEIKVGEDFFDECGNPMEEYMIADWEYDNDVEEELIKPHMSVWTTDIEMLNEYVEKAEDYDDDDIEIAKGIVSETGMDIEEALETESYSMNLWDYLSEMVCDERVLEELIRISKFFNCDQWKSYCEEYYVGDNSFFLNDDTVVCYEY